MSLLTPDTYGIEMSGDLCMFSIMIGLSFLVSSAGYL